MIRELEDFLQEHHIAYTVTYGERITGVLNVEFGDCVVAEDGDVFLLCWIYTPGFRWLTLEELKEFILGLELN